MVIKPYRNATEINLMNYELLVNPCETNKRLLKFEGTSDIRYIKVC